MLSEQQCVLLPPSTPAALLANMMVRVLQSSNWTGYPCWVLTQKLASCMLRQWAPQLNPWRCWEGIECGSEKQTQEEF